MLKQDVSEFISRTFFDSISITRLTNDSKTQLEVNPISEVAKIETNELIIMTISSIAFKFIFTIHYTLDKTTKSFISDSVSHHYVFDSNDDYRSVIAEYANMICGTIKRKLGGSFVYIGLSTPERMRGNCAHHVLGGNPMHQLLGEVNLADESRFYYSMMLHSDHPIVPEKQLVEIDVSEGELELF